MTSVSDVPHSPGLSIAPLRAKWGWIVALGIVYVIAGFIALGSVVMATVASVLVVGIMMIVAFVTFDNPLFAAVLLTLMLGASLVASGIMRIILAFSMRAEMPWIWVALSGVITLLLGLLILARWPINSIYILGLFLGIDLIMAGVSWLGLGFGLHRGRTAPAA
jgi:uncharacterized membrane protein HdeD (DUF308 family)